MTKKQSLLINYAALFVAVFIYLFLRINNLKYLHITQEISLLLILICGLTLIVNNFKLVKRLEKNLSGWLFFVLGIIVSLYPIFILYLMVALQNAGF